MSSLSTERRVEASASQFLRLLIEIRLMIYRHALTSEPVRPLLYPTSIKLRSIGLRQRLYELIFVNRQIYNESSYILYSEGRFIITISEWDICFLVPSSWNYFYTSNCEFFVLHKTIHQRIQRFKIEIFWDAEPSIDPRFLDPGFTLGRRT